MYKGRWYPVAPADRTDQLVTTFKAGSSFANIKVLLLTSSQIVYTYDGKYNGNSFKAYSEFFFEPGGRILQEVSWSVGRFDLAVRSYVMMTV